MQNTFVMWPLTPSKALSLAAPGIPELRTPRLKLRALTTSDTEVVYRAIDANRDEFSRWFTWSRSASRDSVYEGLRTASVRMITGSEWHLGIFDHEDRFVGRIGLSEINRKARTAELGYWLGREFAGDGYMTEAAGALLAFATARAPARITAFADTENAASRRVLEKLGFRWIRTVSRAIQHQERGWRDHEQYVLTAGRNA